MENSSENIEKSIVATTWEDKDTEYVAQYEIHKKHLNLKDIDELEL